MASKTKSYKPSKSSSLVVGYSRLPGRTGSSQAAAGKQFTQSARDSMSGILARFQDLIGSLKGATPEALEMALTPTFEKSQKYCPTDTGELKDSGVLVSGADASGIAYARIAYGGNGAIHYAPIVHERTDLSHKAPTRSKWLQAAVEEDFGKMQRRFTAALKKLSGVGAGA